MQLHLFENNASGNLLQRSIASKYKGARLVVGGPEMGISIGGSFDAYVVTVDGNGSITVTPLFLNFWVE